MKLKKFIIFPSAVFMCLSASAFAVHLSEFKFGKKVEVAEATDLETYYQNVNGSGSDLLLSVRSTISSGYHSLGYDGLWNAYYTTDRRADGKVRDLYSDNTNFTFGSKQCGSYSKIGDCYNREHTIPQNWWGGGTGNQGNDLYIVWPSDGKINGMRSNYPFGETTTGTSYKMPGDPEGNRLGNSTNPDFSGTVFEPFDSRKGDMARVYFYAVARWSAASGWGNGVFKKSGSDSNNGFVQTYLNMLLRWHKLDPVDEFEINRNNAGQALQNNRNPFVDHPSWVDLIWGGQYEGLNEENTAQGRVIDGKLDGGGESSELSSILIEGQTTSYYVGDTFTFDGTCTATYKSGSHRTVTPTIVEMPDMLTAGNKEVVFSYTEDDVTKTFTVNITVSEAPEVEAVGLRIDNPKTTYIVGEPYSPPDVYLRFSNGSETKITEGLVIPPVDTSQPIASQLINISYTYKDELFSEGYAIEVIYKSPLALSFSNIKSQYNAGEEFVKPTVFANYQGGTQIDVTDRVTCSGYNMELYNVQQTVTVTFNDGTTEISATYKIKVTSAAPNVVSIEITGDNNKTRYNIGDKFVRPEVTATYTDASTQIVTSQVLFTGFDSSKAGKISLSASYTENGITVETNFNIWILAPTPDDPVNPDDPSTPSAAGCGGNIAVSSMIISLISLVGISLLFIKRKAKN